MKKLLDNRWFWFAMPFVVWFVVMVLPFIMSSDSGNFPEEARRRFIINILTGNFLLLCVFYLHTYLVYPLVNKKVIWYVLGVLALLGLYWLFWHFLKVDQPRTVRIDVKHDIVKSRPFGSAHPMPRGGRHFRREFGGPYSFFPLMPLIAILFSYCYRVIIDNRARQQLLKDRENVQLQSELTFLRSQISPHFMFNVLNNLVSLARKKSDELEPAIINLSQMMRYMLYESDDNRVQLSKEVDYIKSYINLQMLRFGSNVKVNMDIKGDVDCYTIEPMLLIPFVENAFKHGTGMVENPVIDISLSVDRATSLMTFEVNNTVSPLDVSKDNSSGIGISNVIRRLAILHPGRHNLDIVHENNKFSICLSVDLSDQDFAVKKDGRSNE